MTICMHALLHIHIDKFTIINYIRLNWRKEMEVQMSAQIHFIFQHSQTVTGPLKKYTLDDE